MKSTFLPISTSLMRQAKWSFFVFLFENEILVMAFYFFNNTVRRFGLVSREIITLSRNGINSVYQKIHCHPQLFQRHAPISFPFNGFPPLQTIGRMVPGDQGIALATVGASSRLPGDDINSTLTQTTVRFQGNREEGGERPLS